MGPELTFAEVRADIQSLHLTSGDLPLQVVLLRHVTLVLLVS